MAMSYFSQGDYENALVQHQKALQEFQAFHGQEHPSVADSYDHIGIVYMQQEKYEEALVQFRRALEIRIRVHGLYHRDVAASYSSIGAVYLSQDKHEEALDQYGRSSDILGRPGVLEMPKLSTGKLAVYPEPNEDAD